jgi:hypothetical protein
MRGSLDRRCQTLRRLKFGEGYVLWETSRQGKKTVGLKAAEEKLVRGAKVMSGRGVNPTGTYEPARTASWQTSRRSPETATGVVTAGVSDAA